MRHTSERKKTKVICTLGPSTDSPRILRKMIKSGMDVARLNFSHGTHAEHAKRIRMVRQQAKEMGKIVALLQDLPGPKLRLGKLPNGAVRLKRGEKVILTSSPPFSHKRLMLDSDLLHRVVKSKESIYLADGTIHLKVLKVTRRDIEVEVENEGIARSGNGVNLPKTDLYGAGFFQSDKKHLNFGLENKVDWVAVSFVGSAENVHTVRAICKRKHREVRLVAKIERQIALENLDEIIDEADAVMVARGDLGIEIPLARVPLVQKDIIDKCNRAGKPVIVATQMLESMVSSPRPTRAEATDVANAILDGADAVMLSAETAVGQFPAEAVEILGQISRETEARFPYTLYLDPTWDVPKPDTSFAIGYSACTLARNINAKAIVVPTRSGKTALRVARFKPAQPIVALTRNDLVQRQLALVWNVTPVRNKIWNNLQAVTRVCRRTVLKLGLGKPGDMIIMTSGFPIEAVGGTNLIQAVSL